MVRVRRPVPVASSIGSLGKESEESGVENVTVTGAAFVGTENGLRIKTWARAKVEGAYVRGVAFEHALMHDVRNPIIIDQSYCPNHGRGAGCPHHQVRRSRVRHIHACTQMQFDRAPSRHDDSYI
jgi:polygalacturonase